MKRVVRECLSLVLMGAVLVGLAWVSGFTPDGILFGQWPGSDDHPTNWDDSALHPYAR